MVAKALREAGHHFTTQSLATCSTVETNYRTFIRGVKNLSLCPPTFHEDSQNHLSGSVPVMVTITDISPSQTFHKMDIALSFYNLIPPTDAANGFL